jgi:hypothetical protein
MQLLAVTGHPARRWEPKRLRVRLFSIAGTLATTARTSTLHLSSHDPWTDLALQALNRLRTPDRPPRTRRIDTPAQARSDQIRTPHREWNPALPRRHRPPCHTLTTQSDLTPGQPRRTSADRRGTKDRG